MARTSYDVTAAVQEVADGQTKLATYSHMMGQTGWLKHGGTDGVYCRLPQMTITLKAIDNNKCMTHTLKE